MSKKPSAKSNEPTKAMLIQPNTKNLMIDSDSWDRFERAVDVALRTPAKHKIVTEKKKAKQSPKAKKV